MNANFRMPGSDLKNLIDNFESNQNLPMVTTSIILSTSHLKEMIQKLDDLKAEGVRLYFIRFNKTNCPYTDDQISFVKDLSQVSVAMVPSHERIEKNDHTYRTKDLVNKDGTYTVFFPGGENTGLCPPNCKH